MDRNAKFLYHQIHPVKLLTDFATSFLSSWLLWEGRWQVALVVAFAPSIVVTAWLLFRCDLEPYRRTPMGRYVSRHMTRGAVHTRIAGQIVMWIGAIVHQAWLLPLGFCILIFGWLRGLWHPPRTRSTKPS
ncbi:hypothetical protein LVJ94_21415 [Pendulispora rubella]|uniref:Uncharacterized protein n=1 Tax=Pendulispora rubella TaxID=2741070 RepID=A0ABZ2LKW9_9BACT